MAIARRTALAGMPASTAAATSVVLVDRPELECLVGLGAGQLAGPAQHALGGRPVEQPGRLHPPERSAVQTIASRGENGAAEHEDDADQRQRRDLVVAEQRPEGERDHGDEIRDERARGDRRRGRPASPSARRPGRCRRRRARDVAAAAPHPKSLRASPHTPNGAVQIGRQGEHPRHQRDRSVALLQRPGEVRRHAVADGGGEDHQRRR